MGFLNFISESAPVPLPPSTWTSIIDGVTDYISPANIVTVLASVVGAGIVFVFLWWGIRLAFRSIMGAVKNGTLSISSRHKRGR